MPDPTNAPEPCRDCSVVGGHMTNCARYAEWFAMLPPRPTAPRRRLNESRAEHEIRLIQSLAALSPSPEEGT